MTRTMRTAFLATVGLAVLLSAGPASATVDPTPVLGTQAGSNTEMTFTDLGPGQGVTGFIADPSNPFDPVANGYPTTNPTAGFTAQNEGFAGVIIGTPTGGGAPLSLYCIDIRTTTSPGTGYELGTWGEANVPNVGYVAQVLNSYYPNTNEPASLASLNQKAAAVQAAIWFFSDRYVLNTADPLHTAVAAITADVIAKGPLLQPPPPSLTINPTTQSGPQGTAVGPFTVTATASTAVTAIGGSMFADAAATVPIANGATVASGAQIWLTSTGPGTAILRAKAQATVPTGNVYLYDGNAPGVNSAQKLILAESATLSTAVNAQAVFQLPGSLVVNKTIAGPAAGQQGPIVITVICNDEPLSPLFTIPAGTPAGTVSQTYSNIAAGSVCRVIELADGHIPTVTVQLGGSGTVVTIPAGGTATADLSNTYAVGSLIVNKTITGNGAGQQGDVTISVTCGATALADFVIPAGTAAGTVAHEYTGIPAGSVCTATETANGSSATVTVTTEGTPQSVTIAPNGSGTVTITDTYDLVPGSLLVTKTLTGPAAGQQELIGLLITCSSGDNFAYLIPSGTPAGALPRIFNGIPAGSTCTVTEALNGSSATVASVSIGSGQQATITPGGVATIDLTNTVSPLETPTTPPTTATTAPAPTPPSTEPATMPETLPRTGGGSDAGSLLVIGLTAGGAGALLVLVTRRRATAPRQ